MKPIISLFWSQIDVAEPNICYIQARYPGGTTVAQLRLDVDDEAGWIAGIYVQPSSQGKGLGSLLLEYAFAVCRQRGFALVGLSVHHENVRAQQLYKRLGFITYLQGYENCQQYIKVL